MYFILKGFIILFHKKSQTFIKELGTDDIIGEFAFFSGQARKATARSKHISEVLILNQSEFMMNAENYPKAKQIFMNIKKSNLITVTFSSNQRYKGSEDPWNQMLPLLRTRSYGCEL